MVMFLFCLWPQIPFLSKFCPKKWSCCQFKLKFWYQRLSLIYRIRWHINVFCFRPGTYFWTNLVQKINTVSLRSIFLQRIIRICRKQKWLLFLLFSAEENVNCFCSFLVNPRYITIENRKATSCMIIVLSVGHGDYSCMYIKS